MEKDLREAVKILKTLIKCGSNINIRTNRLLTSLHYIVRDASSDDFLPAIKLLVKNNADINIKTKFGHTILHIAASNDNCSENLMKYILSLNININESSHSGDTALMDSLFINNNNISKLLIQNNADVNIKNINGYTPLINCCDSDNSDETILLIDKIKLLIENNADINTQDHLGNTALHYAAIHSIRNKNMNKINILLKYQADVNIINHLGYNVLHYVIQYKQKIYTKLLSSLIPKNIDTISHNGNTMLHSAICYQKIKIIKELLKLGININHQNNDGDSALHIIATNMISSSCLNRFAALVNSGIDIYIQNNLGWTALHCVLYMKHYKSPSLIKSVINCYNNTDIKTFGGETALHFLSKKIGNYEQPEFFEILELMIYKTNDIFALDADNKSAYTYINKLSNKYAKYFDIYVTNKNISDLNKKINIRRLNKIPIQYDKIRYNPNSISMKILALHNVLKNKKTKKNYKKICPEILNYLSIYSIDDMNKISEFYNLYFNKNN